MNANAHPTDLNTYGITYAHLDERGIYYESELAVQMEDGSMAMLRMPTSLGERQAIRGALFSIISTH
ncbi:type III secretion system co-regulatory protein PtrC [Marinobacter sp.]|uniref:type III secretion system co-regulatory protein PtrC n=1 Tax=Pseudomonadales TaxID=72274 RepID=UPI003A910A05|nr:hypothetical protein [Stutzerimonas stutzeri]MBK3852598.1 hypothetical protein [Stutzerimonas stutzeri]